MTTDPEPSLAAENEALLDFLYVCPVGLIELSAAGDVAMMNPHAAQLLMPVAGAAGISNLFVALQDRAPDIRHLVASFAAPRGPVFESKRIHVGTGAGAPGAPQVLGCSLIKMDEARFMAVLSDVTEQVALERRIKEADTFFATILAGVNDFALLSLDAQGRIRGWNESGFRQTGHEAREVVGRTMNVFYPPDEAMQGRALQQVDLARRDGWHVEEGWRRRKGGERYWCQSLVSAVEERQGEVTGFSVVLRDVTERRAGADEIRRLLTTDPLTGLLNRAHFFELADVEMQRATRFGQPLSAMMIDVDHIRQINAAHGQAVGDSVLIAVAELLRIHLRAIDLIGRVGGEEFAVLLPTIDLVGGRAMAELLRSGIAALRLLPEDVQPAVTVSIGCAEIGGEVATVESLMLATEAALVEAKRSGRNRVATRPGSAGPTLAEPDLAGPDRVVAA